MKFQKIFVFAICLSLILFESCSSVDIPKDKEIRVSDFQIHASFFAAGKFFSIEQMDNQKFLAAVKSSDYENVKKQLENSAVSAKTCDNFHQTALMWACWNSDYKMVKLLLDYQDTYKDSLPWYRKISLLWWLYYQPVTIDKKSVNDKSDNNYMALFCAAYKGDDQLMNLLLAPDADKKKSSYRNAEISERNHDKNGENLLHKMAKSVNAKNMREFLLKSDEYGVKSIRYKSAWSAMYYEKNKNGYTPFHLAILNNDFQMVLLFLELEKYLKRVGNEPIVNIYADLGKQRVYPLYTAYKVRNPDIFRLLLKNQELDIDIRFPDGNAEHDYEHIDDEFRLEKKRQYVFEEQKKNTDTFKTLDYDVSEFSGMYEMRWKWEDPARGNRQGELIVTSAKLNENKSKVIEIIESGTENGVFLEISTAIKRLKELKRNLYDNLSGTGYEEGKDLLELAVKNKVFKTDEKLTLLDWLLGNGYRSLDADNDILYFCLHGANSSNDFFKIAEKLIYSKTRYEDSYSFQRLGRESYVQIMTNPYIRNLDNSWNRLKKLLDTINYEYEFKNEKVQQNITCAVIRSIEPSHGKQNEFPKYAIELFNYFREQYSYEIRIDNSPLCSWFFEIGFDKGVDEILNDEQLAKNLKLNTMFDINNKRFIDLLNDSAEQDEQRKQKIEEWKNRYRVLFPDPVNNINGTKKNKSKSHAKDIIPVNDAKSVPTMEPTSNKKSKKEVKQKNQASTAESINAQQDVKSPSENETNNSQLDGKEDKTTPNQNDVEQKEESDAAKQNTIPKPSSDSDSDKQDKEEVVENSVSQSEIIEQ